MPTRQEIIDNTKSDIEEKLNKHYGYNTNIVSVIYGVPHPNDVNQYPALGFKMINDVILDEDLGGERERQALFVVVGYTNNVDDLSIFSEDVEKFLYSEDYRYGDETMLSTEGVTFTAEGISGEVGKSIFDLFFIVNYTQEF